MGSSKVPMSASEEVAKVGTPRKRETRCSEARRAAGAAGIGTATVTARTAARKTRPSCFTVCSGSLWPDSNSLCEGLFVSQAAHRVNLHLCEWSPLNNDACENRSNCSTSLRGGPEQGPHHLTLTNC